MRGENEEWCAYSADATATTSDDNNLPILRVLWLVRKDGWVGITVSRLGQ